LRRNISNPTCDRGELYDWIWDWIFGVLGAFYIPKSHKWHEKRVIRKCRIEVGGHVFGRSG
jgi:hypothetical protein